MNKLAGFFSGVLFLWGAQAQAATVSFDAFPGAIESAVASIPKRAHKHFRKAVVVARPVLEARAPRAWSERSGEAASVG